MSALSEPSAAPSSRAGFRLILSALALTMAGAAAPSPFYPVLRDQIGFSAATMTGIFAIYAAALLLTLLVAGSISDHLGRRPVLSAGFVLLAASMAAFGWAGSVPSLLFARVLQGAASGVLLSTLTAAATDLEPPERPGAASIWNAVIAMAGLGAGALGAGLALETMVAPRAMTFEVFTLIYAALAALVWLPPETSARVGGALGSLRPRVGVPTGARAAFRRSTPAVIASWATGGLFLSLGAPIVARIFGAGDELVQGAVVALLAGAGALSCFLARRLGPRRLTQIGTDALAAGTLVSVVAVASGSFWLYLASVALAGVGFGTCFYGVLRSVTPTVAAHERGELFAAFYTLSYAAYGLPALAAGSLLPWFGLTPTTYGYSLAIVALAATAGALRRFTTRD